MTYFQRILTTSIMALLLLPVLLTDAQKTEIVIDAASLIQKDKTLFGNPYVHFGRRGLRWCAEECKRRPQKCLSFNYVLDTSKCELNNKSTASPGAFLMTKLGVFYSEASAWPDNMLGPCDALQCSPSERCAEDQNGDAACFVTECPDAPSQSNATLPRYYYKELGSAVNYTCNPGYVPTREPTIVCKTSAEWTRPAFTCDDCGPPPSVPRATPTGSSRSPGSIMSYSCDSGTTAIGATQVACDTQGNWATPTFTCSQGTPTSTSGTTIFIWGNTGVVESPGYPGNYGNNLDVKYYIVANQTGPQSVHLTITHNLEQSSSGCYDYLIVQSDGHKYCGASQTTETKTITFSGNTFHVDFHSNSAVTRAAGFRIVYNVVV